MYFKNIQFQIDVTPTANVASNPLTGISTGIDGFLVCGSAPYWLGFATNNITNGIAGTNLGLRCESNVIYSFAQNSLKMVGLFCSNAGANVSFITFREDK